MLLLLLLYCYHLILIQTCLIFKKGLSCRQFFSCNLYSYGKIISTKAIIDPASNTCKGICRMSLFISVRKLVGNLSVVRVNSKDLTVEQSHILSTQNKPWQILLLCFCYVSAICHVKPALRKDKFVLTTEVVCDCESSYSKLKYIFKRL